MSASTFLICSVLAVACGYLAQQAVQTLINTYLVLLPLDIRTTR